MRLLLMFELALRRTTSNMTRVLPRYTSTIRRYRWNEYAPRLSAGCDVRATAHVSVDDDLVLTFHSQVLDVDSSSSGFHLVVVC